MDCGDRSILDFGFWIGQFEILDFGLGIGYLQARAW
jgi:hypothetical protein